MTGQVPPGGWDRPIPSYTPPALPPAGWWSRVAAALLDLVVIAIPAGLVGALMFGGVTAAFSADGGIGLFALVLAVIAYLLLFATVAILYAPLLMRRAGARNGQTLGKQLVGIRVVRTNGLAMDFTWSALREAGVKGVGVGLLSTVIPVVPYLLDVLWPLWDDEARALHDMVMATRVVRA